MQDPNYASYETQDYDTPSLPYIPYVAAIDSNNIQSTSNDVQASLPEYSSPQAYMPSTDGALPAYVATTSPAPSTTEPFLAAPPAARKRRRRGLWMVLGLLVALIVISAVAITSVMYVNYVNRSTPKKTLDTFCTALQNEDYQTAYNQFSKDLRGNSSEGDFAKALSGDKITACTHGPASEDGTSVTTTMRLVYQTKDVNNLLIGLTKDSSNIWKINTLQRV